MTKLERLLLLALLVIVVYLIISGRARSRELSRMRSDLCKLTMQGEQVQSPYPPDKKNRKSLLDIVSHSQDSDQTVVSDVPTRKIVRGEFDFVGANNGNYCYVDGDLYRVGLLTEYGLCKVVTKNSIICVDGLQETIILPCRKSSPGDAPVSGASSGAF